MEEYEEPDEDNKDTGTGDQSLGEVTSELEVVGPEMYDKLISVRGEILDKRQLERDATPPTFLLESAINTKKKEDLVTAVKTLEQEKKRQQMKLEILQRITEGESQSSLAKEFGLSKKQVFNIAHSKSRLDGSTRPGRRTGLLPSTEVLLAHEIAFLSQEKLISLTGEEFSRYCQMLWKAEGHIGEPPKFGEKYRRGFSQRHKNLALKAYRVSPKRHVRHQAATVANVSRVLNSLKVLIGKVLASRVYTVDELDVSANDKGLGAKHLAVAGIKPCHVTDDRTPHISACPFIPLSGSRGYCAFVVQGLKEPAEINEEYALDRGQILRNSKGSVDTTTWREIIKGFVQFVDKKMGTFRKERSFHLYLLFDGYSVHKDVETLNLLEGHGIKVFCIPPNLTHVIQINDHGRINGKIQEKVRKHKAFLCQLNGNRMVSIERWCYEVDKLIWTTVNALSVMTAAGSIGIRYTDNLEMISMTNASVEQAVRNLLNTGRITQDSEVADSEVVDLRDRDYVDVLKTAGRTVPYPSLITEQTIKAMKTYSDQLILERTGTKPSPRPRRAYKRVTSPTASHPYDVKVLTDPSKGVANRKYEALKAIEVAKQIKKEEKLKKRNEREQKAAEKQSRFEDLQASFREFDIEPFKRSVARYLSGTQSRENAVGILHKKLKLSNPCN